MKNCLYCKHVDMYASSMLDPFGAKINLFNLKCCLGCWEFLVGKDDLPALRKKLEIAESCDNYEHWNSKEGD